MNILIRCDAGGEHGLGHATRMVALADALTERGATVAFISDTVRVLANLVAPYACLNVSTTRYDALECLVVDTKTPIAESWYRTCGSIKVVRVEHPYATVESCDLVVMPNNHLQEPQIQRLRDTFQEHFLYGWNYVMLTSEVTNMEPIPYRGRQEMEGIVFVAGGSDPTGAQATMYQWITELDLDVPYFFPAWGHRAAYLGALRHARLVVGFIGQTVYECAWYKTPMLCFARTSEDAMSLALLEEKSGGSLQGGNVFSSYTQEEFVSTVGAAWRKTVPWPSFLDGHGTVRVAEKILSLHS